MGSGLLQLAAAAALVTASVLWIAEQSQPVGLHCPPGPSFRQHAALMVDLPAGPIITMGGTGRTLEEASLDPEAASVVTGIAADAMHRVGWRASTQFARFDPTASLASVLDHPRRFPGSYLLIIPGNGTLARRAEHIPFLFVDPSATDLRAVLSPAAAALNKAAGVWEATALGRRMFAFHLEVAPLLTCRAGTGPCAVWEASSGRVVLDSWLAGKMAAMAGGAGPDSSSSSGAAAGGDGIGGGAGLEQPGDGAGSEAGGGSGGLPALLAAFAEKVAELAGSAAGLMQSGKASSLPTLAGSFAQAGASAVVLLMAGPTPLWWCITCPVVLGLLAPFIFNFGLTAAAEALCAQLQLPDDTCSDLWWGAFALALVLSFGAAVPIVYICRLPECGRRGGAAAVAAASMAVARMMAS